MFFCARFFEPYCQNNHNILTILPTMPWNMTNSMQGYNIASQSLGCYQWADNAHSSLHLKRHFQNSAAENVSQSLCWTPLSMLVVWILKKWFWWAIASILRKGKPEPCKHFNSIWTISTSHCGNLSIECCGVLLIDWLRSAAAAVNPPATLHWLQHSGYYSLEFWLCKILLLAIRSLRCGFSLINLPRFHVFCQQFDNVMGRIGSAWSWILRLQGLITNLLQVCFTLIYFCYKTMATFKSDECDTRNVKYQEMWDFLVNGV
jgi:hypothetical protein